MELRHLRYFVVVAEELHFGRAAERLGIAQPPLSQQIQRFERDLGTTLFERNRRMVRLTPAGRALLPEARDILARAESARKVARRAGAGETGWLAIGFVGSATLSILPEILRHFRESYPHVVLDLREMSTSQQIEAVTSRVIDAGFARTARGVPPIQVTRVMREPLVVAMPDDLVADAPDPVDLSALAGAPFVMSPEGLGSEFHSTVTTLCARAGFEPQIVQEAVQMQTIVGLVAAGIGVAIVPASLKRFRRDGVTYRRLEIDGAYSELSIIRRDDEASPALRNFVDLALAIGGQAG